MPSRARPAQGPVSAHAQILDAALSPPTGLAEAKFALAVLNWQEFGYYCGRSYQNNDRMHTMITYCRRLLLIIGVLAFLAGCSRDTPPVDPAPAADSISPGGGGTGGANTGSGQTSGTANTGGGGGGTGGGDGNDGKNGGSGVVILRYPSNYTITVGAGLTANSTGTDGDYSYKIITAGTGNVSWA